MSRYEITVKEYFFPAEREYRTCEVLEEYLPEDFAQAAVLLHISRAIEMMLKALWVVNGTQPDPHICDTYFLADTKVLKDPLPDELTEEICDTVDLWEEVGYELVVPFDQDEYETAKRIYTGLKETVVEHIRNGKDNNPIILGDKDADETYQMPDDIKALITEEFGREFFKQLAAVFGNGICKGQSNEELLAVVGFYLEGTKGWCTALEKAADITGCSELFKYYKALPWYDCDIFDGELYDLVCGYEIARSN